MTIVEPPLRYELKFVAPSTAPRHLVHWLRAHPMGFRPAYPPRRVNSIYFDSMDYADYAQTLAGLSCRAKVRLRWYGDGMDVVRGQLEVKRKRDRVSWKLTYAVPREISLADPWTCISRTLRRELPPEAVPWLIERPSPIILNRYLRYYYELADGSIRATVDVDQEVYDQRYASRPNRKRRSPVPATAILEMKVPAQEHREAERCLAGLRLSLRRNSKYCIAVQAVSG